MAKQKAPKARGFKAAMNGGGFVVNDWRFDWPGNSAPLNDTTVEGQIYKTSKRCYAVVTINGELAELDGKKIPAKLKDTRTVKNGQVEFGGLIFNDPALRKLNGKVIRCEMFKGTTTATFTHGERDDDAGLLTILNLTGEKKAEPKALSKDEREMYDRLKDWTKSSRPLHVLFYVLNAEYDGDADRWSVPSSRDGKRYTVDGDLSNCNCDGFRARRECTHIKACALRSQLDFAPSGDVLSSQPPAFDDDIPF